MAKFTASYDLTTKIVSSLVSLAMLSMAIFIHMWMLAILPALILVGAYAYSVNGYTIDNGLLIVRRPAGSVRIPLAGIIEARRAQTDDLAGCIRLFGSGGLFGYYGLFRTSKLGRCTWYVTNRANMVIVRTQEQITLHSPDNVDAFLAALPAVSRSPEYPFTIPRTSSLRWGLAAFGMLIALGTIILLGWVTRYSPGPVPYTLTPQSLAIRDRFYPITLSQNTVNAGAVQIIDMTQHREWRPVARTGGFSNSHYRSGHFRAANGQSMRLYWAGGTRLVLLPSKDGTPPILMEVADPDSLVQALRQEWLVSR